MTDEIKQRPKICMGAIIVNKEGKMLLTRQPKWQNMLTWPGGHIEWGETMEEAIKREVKEEVGLDVYDPKLVEVFEFIESDSYVKNRHIISMDHFVKTDNKPDDVKIDGVEITEYLWLTPEEALKNPEVEETTREDVKKYIEKFVKKHGIFSKICKDCEKYKKESEEFKSGWQRALADYKNLQREVEQRRGEWVKMSEVEILEDFIPIYENFKQAFAVERGTGNGERIDNWAVGIECIKKQFAEVLKQHGVEEIKTVGEKFDPALHEASGEDVVEGKEVGEIVREVSGGYKMGGKVIRAARVIVCK